MSDRFVGELPPGTCRSLVGALLRVAPVAVSIFDRDLRFVAVSERWFEDFGVERDVLGKSFYEVMPGAEEWKAVHQQCLEGEPHRSDQERLEGHWVRWSIDPWHDIDGSVGGMIMFSSRIDEQVETRRRLEEQEDFVRAFFDRSPIGLNLCRMDGLWVESNPAFLDIIGYDREEADGGLTYWELTPRKYDPEEKVQLESLASTKRYGPYEKEFIRKDGSLIPVRLNGFIIDRGGEEFIWSLIEDITELKELEEKLDAERMKAIQASKLATMGEMAAGFAHEINNPLAIIDASAYDLEHGVAEKDHDLLVESVKSIRGATERAAKIVRSLRKFARMDDHRETTPFPIGALVDDALDLCRTRIKNHGVELRVEVESSAEVRCSAIEMAQVLVNLLNNAFDAVLESDDRWIRLSVEDRADEVAVRVEDSGSGVSDEAAERLFQPFFTTKPVGKGTGLGLSISRGIVEAVGGTIRLVPDVKHTCFEVVLPRAGDA